ncbi:MAG: ribonuclease E/G [Holosporales bacterium]|jgi:ribonuclease E|nr:ribonuclease E/G [Holosporales bacterium]
MAGKLLIDAHYADETRFAILGEDERLEKFETEYSDRKPIKGNIYLAKIFKIEPSIQAAFIDYGGIKHGFLPLSEIHYNYFSENILKIPETKESEECDNSKNFEERPHYKKPFRIQDVISSRKILLVQAIKEGRGNKCAFFTTFISLPGRYCILMPNPPRGKTNAISKKIDVIEKGRLQEIVNSLDVPDGMNCIIRTAGENRTKQEIKRDLEYLCRLWGEIRGKAIPSLAPLLVHEESSITKRAIRDLYQKTMDKIIIQGKEAYKEARTFMKTFAPSHIKKIELYEEVIPIFHKYEIEDKIEKILEPTVTLPSGGSIVINTTEALTAIDVNSGKSRNEKDINKTALQTNFEAAAEIAKQISLRDIGGIIVIDFIDMDEYQSNIKIEKKLREAMKNDYSNIQFGKISQFGLMEISRQRLRTSLVDAAFIQCPHCKGSGKTLINETIALSVIRKIEKFLVSKEVKSILVEVVNGVDLFMLNYKRKLISEMENSFGVFIEISGNASLSAMGCKIIVKEYKIKESVNQTPSETTERKTEELPQIDVTVSKTPDTQLKKKGTVNETKKGQVQNENSKTLSSNNSSISKNTHTSSEVFTVDERLIFPEEKDLINESNVKSIKFLKSDSFSGEDEKKRKIKKSLPSKEKNKISDNRNIKSQPLPHDDIPSPKSLKEPPSLENVEQPKRFQKDLSNDIESMNQEKFKKKMPNGKIVSGKIQRKIKKYNTEDRLVEHSEDLKKLDVPDNPDASIEDSSDITKKSSIKRRRKKHGWLRKGRI